MFSKLSSTSKGQAAADASSYIALRYSNSIFIVVALRYTRNLSILLQSESCDIVRAHQLDGIKRLKILFCFFRAYKGRFRHKVSWSLNVSIACENDVLPKKTSTQWKSKLPSRKYIEYHFRINYFLSFIDHIISRFPQELQAIFYDNYLVPALVNNVNPKIYPNDIPHEVDRWGDKIYPLQLTVCQHTQTQFCTQMWF